MSEVLRGIAQLAVAVAGFAWLVAYLFQSKRLEMQVP